MKINQFDIDKYHRHIEQVNAAAKGFFSYEYLPVCIVNGSRAMSALCRDKKTALESQLDDIADTLSTKTDWIPELIPYKGCGIYAAAFGSEYRWFEDAPPSVHGFLAKDLEEMKAIEAPDIDRSPILNSVLETAEYFASETNNEIYMTTTDTQSPFDVLAMMVDNMWLFTEAAEYPEELHRLMSDITDVIIAFTKRQRALFPKLRHPGAVMWTPDIHNRGQLINDDQMVLVGPEYYHEFIKPYNQRIADAFGGLTIHSCGRWSHQFEQVKSIMGLTMVDLAVSKAHDPGYMNAQTVADAFDGSGIIVQARCDFEDKASYLPFLEKKQMLTELQPFWNDDPAQRSSAYDQIKHAYEAAHENQG